ncbi:MAG: hypothetical protein K0Q79_1036 [Flavipsychrobacter sp.]|jgi:hypothetical protein|nr:hypothetical protein [Flavipsychrobacter sp.]
MTLENTCAQGERLQSLRPCETLGLVGMNTNTVENGRK